MLQSVLNNILKSEIILKDDVLIYSNDNKKLFSLERTSKSLIMYDSNNRIIATFNTTDTFNDLSNLNLIEFNNLCGTSILGAIPQDYRFDSAFIKIFKALNLTDSYDKTKALFSLQNYTFYNRFVSLQNLAMFLNSEIDAKDLEILKKEKDFSEIILKREKENSNKRNKNKKVIDYGAILFDDNEELFRNVTTNSTTFIFIEFALLMIKKAFNQSIEDFDSIKFKNIFDNIICKIDEEYNEKISKIQSDIDAMQNEADAVNEKVESQNKEEK